MKVFRKFNQILDKRQKSRIVILFFLTLIGTVLEVLGVSLMIPLIQAIMVPDIITTNKYIAKVCEILDLHSHRTFVIACIGALILIFIFKDLFLMFEYYVRERFVCNNRLATEIKLFEAFLNKPYEYYLNASTGEIMRIISDDVRGAYGLLTTLIYTISEMVVSFGLLVTIFIIDPKMSTFVAVLMIVLMAIITHIIKPKLARAGRENQINSAIMYKWKYSAITGIKEIIVTRKKDFFKENYINAGKRLVRTEQLSSVCGNIPRLLIEMVSVCSMLLFIGIQIYCGRDIESLIPALGAFAMAAVKLMPAANRIVSALNQIAYSTPVLDKVIEHLTYFCDNNGNASGNVNANEAKPGDNSANMNSIGGKYTVINAENENCGNDNNGNDNNDDDNNRKDSCDTGTALTFKNKIEFKNITYRYPNANKDVLYDATMEIPIGKSVGIVGTSGAGKTTVVDVLLGLLRPKAGEILLDGKDVMQNYSAWLSNIGYIPQMIFLIDESIKKNVAFGVKDEDIDEKRVWEALHEAQLDDYVRELPKGIDTEIGERGIRLSGGQRQRIGIARALYPDPEFLIFDEATSALDNETEKAIMESINSLQGKKTMVIIAHRLETIKKCDMVYRVKDKKIERDR